jgi:hypothetical protein
LPTATPASAESSASLAARVVEERFHIGKLDVVAPNRNPVNAVPGIIGHFEKTIGRIIHDRAGPLIKPPEQVMAPPVAVQPESPLPSKTTEAENYSGSPASLP